MSFDPTLPVDDSVAEAAELRNQFNALKALFDGLESKLASLVPTLNRDAGGQWTLTYSGPTQSSWQVWTRYEGSPDWSEFGEVQTSQFPSSDAVMSPGGSWWQVKICGEGSDGNLSTPFSNTVSFGPVPDA